MKGKVSRNTRFCKNDA